MTGWLFPGQPLRCEQFTDHNHDLDQLHQLCCEVTGYDLLKGQPCSDGTLSNHTALQIHGVVSSLYRSRCLKKSGETPDLLAEHSLGIYAALAVAGCISEQVALELVARIGNSMSKLAGSREYALGCPIGLPVGLVEAAARNNGVYVANYNTSRHFLLAGVKQNIETALAECQAAGAFSVSSFACEAPLHTPLMAEISSDLAAIVADYRFVEPQIPLIESLAQTSLSAAAIPAFLVDELQQPVYWERTWKFVRAAGVTRCTEVGSGQALTKFNRWIDSEAGAL